MDRREEEFCLKSLNFEIAPTYITLYIRKARVRKFSYDPHSK